MIGKFPVVGRLIVLPSGDGCMGTYSVGDPARSKGYDNDFFEKS